ncbi:ATP-binding protein [Paenibacillus solisilvae]|uniref:histidine kinase n=1 Tax=Paenibacillus solisilvae TaxID=2486751 RepID=A0ABW0W2U4_9BACL
MSELIVSDKWMFLLLALAINLFASFTMYNMIGHLMLVRVLRHYWLLSGAVVYGLGLWVSHFIMLLTTDSMITIDWTSILKLLFIMACAYSAFQVLGSSMSFMPRLLGSGLLMSLGMNMLIYSSLLSGQIQRVDIHMGLAAVAFVIGFMGALCSFYLYVHKQGVYLLLPGVMIGLANFVMQVVGIEAFTAVYTAVLTTDRLNEYMRLLAVVLGMATLVIFAISLLARFVDRRYNAMNERYKLLVEHSIDMIAVIRNEQWEYVNTSGLQMFEAQSEKDLLGKSIYINLQPKFHNVMKRMLQVTGQGGRQGPIELDWYTVEGRQLYTEVVETCTNQSGKPVYQFIIRDISERKKNEELLINSEKLYVAGQLAAGIAHEIRNPLTSLKGFLQLIASGRNSSKNYYDIMKSELIRIESIVSELLMLSKPQIYELVHKDIRQIVNDTVILLEAQAILNNIEIDSIISEEPLWVFGVENQLKQLFINVLKNAIDAMQGGGRINVRCIREGDLAVVRIEDYGPGIPEEQLSKIGQPFYTTKEKGTGLGLMVSYKIVDNHQGRIKVHSSIGVSTTFEICLPYSRPFERLEAAQSRNGKVTPIHRPLQESESR